MVSSALPDDANTPIIFKFSTDMIPILMLSVTAETLLSATRTRQKRFSAHITTPVR